MTSLSFTECKYPAVGGVGPPRRRQRAERDGAEQAADDRDEQRDPPHPPPASPPRVPRERHAVIVRRASRREQVWRLYSWLVVIAPEVPYDLPR
jgi:hypothetical protein